MKLRKVLLLSVICLLTSCKEEIFSYHFDLIKVSKIKNYSDNALINVELHDTPLKRIFGATIKSGSPYKVYVCTNNDPLNIPKLKKIVIYRILDSGNIPVYADLNIDKKWNNNGIFLCMGEIAKFDGDISENSKYCVDTTIELKNEIKQERACFLFSHEIGDGKISINDVLMQ